MFENTFFCVNEFPWLTFFAFAVFRNYSAIHRHLKHKNFSINKTFTCLSVLEFIYFT